MKLAVLGAGALAMAICKIIEEDDSNEIVVWTKFEEEKLDIEQSRQNTKMLPGVKISENIKITNNLEEAIIGADVIFNILPFIAVPDIITELKEIYKREQIILSATKGISEDSFVLTTDLLKEGLNTQNVLALSGPSFAKEIANKDNISFMLGYENIDSANKIKKILERDYIEIELTEDISGIQLAGGIKNAIAIGSGMLSGLKAADSTKAAYLAKGMADMSKLLVSLGGKKETTYSYAGVGDLILTCMSTTSRNFTFGNYLGQGLTKEQAFEKMNKKTVEGYKTIRALYKYAKLKNLELYTINTLYNIIFENGKVNTIKKV